MGQKLPTIADDKYLWDLSVFPFMPAGGDYMKKQGYQMADFDDFIGIDIVKSALRKVRIQVVEGSYELKRYRNPDEAVMEFLACALILRLADDTGQKILIKKFAMQEARRVQKILEGDIMPIKENRFGLLQELFRYVSGFPIEADPDSPYNMFCVRVPHYLIMSSAYASYSQSMKLVNQLVKDGVVYLPAYTALRLARDGIANRIRGQIMSIPVDSLNVAKSIQKAAAELRDTMEETKSITYRKAKVVEAEFAPCAKHCIELLRNGENLSDSGRFFIASYLMANGRTVDDVVEYFKNAPDFNETVTRYHLKHIENRGQQYKVTGCEKLRNIGLCFPHPQDCYMLLNPMQFPAKKDDQEVPE